MNPVQEIEATILQLTHAEVEQLRAWTENYLQEEYGFLADTSPHPEHYETNLAEDLSLKPS